MNEKKLEIQRTIEERFSLICKAALDERLDPRDTQHLAVIAELSIRQPAKIIKARELAESVGCCLRTTQYSLNRLRNHGYLGEGGELMLPRVA